MITDTIMKAIIVVLAALLLALGAYHLFETRLLKSDIESKAKAISSLTSEKATLTAANVVLVGANRDFDKLVKEQNSSIEALKKERDTATAKWKAAEKKAAQESQGFQKTIDEIMATSAKAGQSWCDAWKGVVDRYFEKRKAAP